MLKARVHYFFAAVLVVAGLGLLVCVLGTVAWQINGLVQTGKWVPLPATLLIAETPYAQLTAVLAWMPVGLPVGLAACVLLLAGLSSALRQSALIRYYKQRNADGLRRMHEYRREPFLKDS